MVEAVKGRPKDCTPGYSTQRYEGRLFMFVPTLLFQYIWSIWKGFKEAQLKCNTCCQAATLVGDHAPHVRLKNIVSKCFKLNDHKLCEKGMSSLSMAMSNHWLIVLAPRLCS